mmetsp:Transcript_19871/g.52173  ORF Transcript_19871/g.52173 Transcript_19871/m.52173 type:complete len:459 (-) Transcript_19871:334-1710(-)
MDIPLDLVSENCFMPEKHIHKTPANAIDTSKPELTPTPLLLGSPSTTFSPTGSKKLLFAMLRTARSELAMALSRCSFLAPPTAPARSCQVAVLAATISCLALSVPASITSSLTPLAFVLSTRLPKCFSATAPAMPSSVSRATTAFSTAWSTARPGSAVPTSATMPLTPASRAASAIVSSFLANRDAASPILPSPAFAIASAAHLGVISATATAALLSWSAAARAPCAASPYPSVAPGSSPTAAETAGALRAASTMAPAPASDCPPMLALPASLCRSCAACWAGRRTTPGTSEPAARPSAWLTSELGPTEALTAPWMPFAPASCAACASLAGGLSANRDAAPSIPFGSALAITSAALLEVTSLTASWTTPCWSSSPRVCCAAFKDFSATLGGPWTAPSPNASSPGAADALVEPTSCCNRVAALLLPMTSPATDWEFTGALCAALATASFALVLSTTFST